MVWLDKRSVMNNYQAQQLNDTIAFVTSIMVLGFMVGMVRLISGNLINPTIPIVKREELAISRWNQILKYCHTLNDIKRIANRQGIIKLYHGCPTEFAELLVKEGPRVPYKVEDTGRYVARVYDISWIEFRPYAYRAHEVVERLSTATAPVAVRWAWSFPLGEVLTDLNSHARMFVAFKRLAKEKGISLDDAYDELDKEAQEIARQKGIRYTMDNAPDILGLPDKLALKLKTGALVELEVDTRALSNLTVLSAQQELEGIGKGYWSEQEMLEYWNHQYKDIKIAPGNIKSVRIVIRDMQPWEQDIINEMAKEKRIKVLPSHE